MDLDLYWDRIGVERPLRADLAALRAIHRAHLLAIPYENLDVQLARPVTTAVPAIFEKLVARGRGGWCYEMNGLLGWALSEMGFRVTRSAGAVMREVRGDAAVGNHLVLRIDLDEGVYLADAGFGDGPIDPIRVTPGAFTSHGFGYALERVDGEWWRLRNDPSGGAASFDFNLAEADESVLAERCSVLQTSPESSFVQNLVVQRYTAAQRSTPGSTPGSAPRNTLRSTPRGMQERTTGAENRTGFTALRGRVLRHITPGGSTERLLGSAEELVATLGAEFALDVPEAAVLWPRIVERHEQLFPADGNG